MIFKQKIWFSNIKTILLPKIYNLKKTLLLTFLIFVSLFVFSQTPETNEPYLNSKEFKKKIHYYSKLTGKNVIGYIVTTYNDVTKIEVIYKENNEQYITLLDALTNKIPNSRTNLS